MSEIRKRYSLPVLPLQPILVPNIQLDPNRIVVVGNDPQHIKKMPLYQGHEIKQDMIVRQLSNGHALVETTAGFSGHCLECERKNPSLTHVKMTTFCPACRPITWSCLPCFDDTHGLWK
jgi:hypothetical protein